MSSHGFNSSPSGISPTTLIDLRRSEFIVRSMVTFKRYKFVIVGVLNAIAYLPKIKKISINTSKCMLLLVLDGVLQVADRLRTWNLYRKDAARVMAKNPTVEFEYI